VALEPAPWWADLSPVAEVPGFFERPIRIFHVPDPLPRAYVVDGVRPADGEDAVRALVDPGFDPRREAVLPDVPPGAARRGGAGKAKVTRLGWNEDEIEVDLQREGFVILVDAYDPGWRATIDGRPAEVRRGNVAFRAVAVPPGRHLVRLVYRPRPLAAGLALSALGVVALLALALARRGPVRR